MILDAPTIKFQSTSSTVIEEDQHPGPWRWEVNRFQSTSSTEIEEDRARVTSRISTDIVA